MVYNSVAFLGFLALIVILYYVVPKKLQWGLLLAAGVAFYLFSGVFNIAFIIVTTVVTWLCARQITKVQKEAADKQAARKKARPYVVLALIVDLGLMCFIKYFNFVSNDIVGAIGKAFNPGFQSITLNLVMPLGLSFYTFMAIGYLLDVYWKKYEAEQNILKFAAFTFYFPHVIQGPIGRYDRLAPQLFAERKFDYDRIVSGAELMAWGFFKKMVIADRIGAAINPVLGNVSESTGVSLALSIILYSIQLYADFSGCIDMARGASCMLGIDLDKNFDRPYFSKNMPEFWRRWHISLFGWFKDYLLYPVSISRLSKKLGKFFRHTKSKRAGRLVVSAVCLLVVWLATGLWHGAYWTFILWGLFHGVLLFLSQLTEPWIAKINTKLKVNDSAFGIRFLRCLRTFFLCCVGRIFFRAATVEDSFTMFRKIFGEFHFADFATVLKAMKLSIPNMLVIVAGIIILFVVSLLQRKGELRPRINAKPFPLRWAVLIFLIFGTLIFGMYGVGFSASNFLYANF